MGNGGRRPDIDIATAPRGELERLFTWLGFRDSRGHRLENSVDFQELLDRACTPARESELINGDG